MKKKQEVRPDVDKHWDVYHLSREYSFQRGDPLLGHVIAPDFERARRAAEELGLRAPTGLWVVLVLPPLPPEKEPAHVASHA